MMLLSKQKRDHLMRVMSQVVILKRVVEPVIQHLESALVKTSVSSLRNLRRARAEVPRQQSNPQPRNQQEGNQVIPTFLHWHLRLPQR